MGNVTSRSDDPDTQLSSSVWEGDGIERVTFDKADLPHRDSIVGKGIWVLYRDLEVCIERRTPRGPKINGFLRAVEIELFAIVKRHDQHPVFDGERPGTTS